ncbi:hydroxymethylbilane synthase, partial [Ascoidea rubescens DSM 1968]
SNKVIIGGRKSKLAVIQSELIKGSILHHFPNLDIQIIALSTLGDKIQNKPLYSFGGKSLWTKELEILLLTNLVDNSINLDLPRIDLIVHSLKDMPTFLPPHFELACISEREDPSDAVVMPSYSPYKSLSDLPSNSIVGTSSIRRSAQLLKNFPYLKFQSCRGNVLTRLNKLDDPSSEFDCLILATAGLKRLDLSHRITYTLNSKNGMYHAVGQGALGIEIKKNNFYIKKILNKILNLDATACCLAERSLMRTLEGGCSVPIGVESEFNNNILLLKAIVISVDGKKFVEDQYSLDFSPLISNTNNNKDNIQKISYNDQFVQYAESVGRILANNLIDKGAKEILNEINL